MKKRNGHRLLAALIAVGMCSSMQITLPQKSAAAVAVETTVQNQGLRSDPAYIRGSKAIVTYDAARQSDVLSLDGDGFGEGWLQLPALFETGCSAGFTFSMKVMLDAEADNYSKLFQFSSLPFGTGNAPAYSSPDISVDLNDKTGLQQKTAGTLSVWISAGRSGTTAPIRFVNYANTVRNAALAFTFGTA